MKYLLIDTTTSNVTVAIIENNKILFNYQNTIISDMSSKILPIIEAGFNSVNFNLRDIDKIFVVNGPGSFTGIRVGVTIAKTIASALNKNIITLSSLEYMATTFTDKKYLVPIIDARRGNVFAGIYDNNLKLIEKDSLISLNELMKKIDSNYELISYDNINNSIKPKVDILKIILKHENDKSINPHKVNPNYLKLTEAEERLKLKENI